MVHRFNIIFIVFLFSFLIIPTPTFAAKKFVPKKTTARTVASRGSIPSVVKYRPDKLGILFSFANFSGIDSVNYSFTYNTNGNPQGAGGTIRSTNNPTTSRELLFGTCSTSVCTYHSGLSNARLTLSAKMANGRTVTKAYKIKTYK